MPDLCVIHQPNFFPRLSTLAKIYAGGIWVVLDDVQFVRRDYQHRARLMSLDGSITQWLPLSLHLPNGRASRIKDVSLVESNQTRTFGMIQQHYRRSEHWPTLRGYLDPIVSVIGQTDSLTEVAVASTAALLQWLGWTGVIVRSSSFTVRSGRSERLADLTAVVGATRYLCGEGGSRYLDQLPFDALSVEVQKFSTPTHNDVWTSARKVSALWAFMRHGPELVIKELDQVAALHNP